MSDSSEKIEIEEKKEICEKKIPKSNDRLFYIHGLEGSFKGYKGTYLSKYFNLHGLDMPVSLFNVTKSINAPRLFCSNFFSWKPWNAFSIDYVLWSMAKKCMTIQRNEIIKKRKEGIEFDIFLGSSWGAGLLCGLMREENLISLDSRIILISCAIFKMNKYFKVTENMKKFKNILIIHAKKDTTVPYETALKLHKQLPNSKFVTIENDSHPLNGMVADGRCDEGSLFYHVNNTKSK